MKIVKKSVIRKDAADKVLGRAFFANDIDLPNMLHIKTFRSTKPFAKFKLDIKQAKKVKGVVDIITAKDVLGVNTIPLIKLDHPVLAENVVRFVGESIALVAAETLNAAEEALEKIKIEYEELEPVFDPLETLELKDRVIGKDENIFQSFDIIKGDAEKGFKESDIILEKEYTTNYQEHAYLETQGMVAVPNKDGTLKIIGSMQCPYYVQAGLSMATGLPLSKIEVECSTVGGGFGGKEDMPSVVASHAAIVALRNNRPAKLIYNRREDIEAMSKRHPSYVKIKSGVTKDGKLKAIDIKFVLDAGAYATLSPVVLWRGTLHSAGPYKWENVKVKSYAPATNKVPCGAYRGFGEPQAIFAIESHMDLLAKKLNMDPIEFRKLNILRQNDETITGQKLVDIPVGLDKCIDRGLELIDYENKKKEYEKSNKENNRIKKGIGLALAYYGGGLGAFGRFLQRAGAFIQIFGDGSVQVAVGTAEMGQGMKTVLSQIAAEALGAKYENITFLETNTSRLPDSGPTVASRATMMSGNAIINAANELKQRLLEPASILLKTDKDNIIFEDGYCLTKDRKKRKKWQAVIQKAVEMRTNLAVQGWYKPPETTYDMITGQGNAYAVYSFGAFLCDLQIDRETDEVTINHLVTVLDVGTPVNIQQTQGQIQGGTIQGMGYGLLENMVLDKGKILTNSFSTYIIPGSKDIPELSVDTVDTYFENGPFGAKPFGELPLMGVAPTISNAVDNACGIRIYNHPVIPEKIFEKRKEQ